jgi:hypothetical protein
MTTVSILCLTASAAMAAMPESEYLEMLKIAQQKVTRLKALHAGGNPSALSTSLARTVVGRAYQVGDVWDVIACKERSTMAAMTSEPVRTSNHCALFHYEVTEVKPGADPQVKIRVTQKEGYGLKVADNHIDSMELTTSSRFAQSEKLYHLTNHAHIFASPNGVHTSATPLELYPLDVPEIETAEQMQPSTIPVLPPELQSLATQVGFTAELTHSTWFEQQDLFGREIQVLWQYGDLWPAYLKTPNGTAILVRK